MNVASSSTGPASKILFSLDTPSAIPLNSLESYVRGWFVSDDGQSYELWLIVDQARIPVFTALPRPDVLRHHKNNPAFANPGFLARFSRPKSQTPITVIAAAGNSEIVLAAGIPAPEFGEVFEPGTDAGYRSWLADVEPSLFWPEAEISKRLAALRYQPLISILLHVPEVHVYLVTRSVQSVLDQRYRRWQLCIESPPSEYLDKLAADDARLQLTSNRALDAATGDFVLRLDYRDELHPFALLEIVRALNEGEPADLVYADEDEIDFYGNRICPFRKPEFDPEAFLSWNFIGHMAAARRSRLLATAGDREIDSWDTLFRLLEIPGAPLPRHVPKPLYHFRRGNPTLAPLPRDDRNVSPKPLLDHLARTNIKAAVEPGLFPGSFRLLRECRPDRQIAVLVRSEDGVFQHAALAATIDRRTTRVYELLGSGAELLGGTTPHIVRSLDEIPADVFVFINRPLETLNHVFFDELARQAMREDCAVVSGISLDRTGRILHSAFAGIHFSKNELLRDLRVVRSVDAISDEFFAVKRAQLEALGGLAAVSSARMPELLRRLVDLSQSANSRVLVTPYAVATFDIDVDLKMDAMEKQTCPEDPEPDPALAERNLAAAELRELATETNRMRREMAALRETIAWLEAGPPVAELRGQIQELTAALERERRAMAEIRNSRFWKLAHHLRACIRIARGKS